MDAAAGPDADAPSPSVAPTLRRGLAVAVLYAAIFLAAGLISGVDYDDLAESSSNLLGFVVIPVALAIAGTLALTARWGWWHALFHEDPELRLVSPRWLRAIPVLFCLAIVATLASAPWDEWTVGLVLLALGGTLLVGFGEEIVFRGYLLLGARSRFGEAGAWFLTSALFGLFHGLNILTGQSVGKTLVQIVFAFIFGSGLYLVRRVSGMLVVGMLIHGLWDFATFMAGGRGGSDGAATQTVASAPFVWGTVILIFAALYVLFHRRGSATGPAA